MPRRAGGCGRIWAKRPPGSTVPKIPCRQRPRRSPSFSTRKWFMFRRIVLIGLLTGAVSLGAAEDRGAKNQIDVSHYTITADVNPRTQALTANVQVQFVPVDASVTSAVFELNNALNVSRVVDGNGRQIPASRSAQDFGLRVSFPDPLPKGKPATVTFTYDGRLTGSEDSPV